MSECTAWRDAVVRGTVAFINKDISDTRPTLLDSSLRLLGQLLAQWKSHISSQAHADSAGVPPSNVDVLHEVEGLCLVMMCSCRVVTRKLAVHLMKEV